MTTIPNKMLKSGFSIPVYGLGTWGIGGTWEQGPVEKDVADIEALQAGMTAGVTHIDTAEIYGAGHTEELIGGVIKNMTRSELFITSKVFDTHYTHEGIITSCKQSLKRLQTDYLDLFLFHRYAENLQELLGAMQQLKSEGLIRNIGVSNFTSEQLERAQSLTSEKIVCNQVRYNLGFREPEESGLLTYCQENDVILTAYRPLERGMLNNEASIVAALAQKYQKTPTQIALNWLISQKNVSIIAKTRNPAHLEENLGSVGWEMSREDIERLREEYPKQ